MFLVTCPVPQCSSGFVGFMWLCSELVLWFCWASACVCGLYSVISLLHYVSRTLNPKPLAGLVQVDHAHTFRTVLQLTHQVYYYET